LNAVPGVMEHGLFIDMADAAVIGGPDGVRLVERR
jgi:ribose 5-phosphate isomerase A